MIPKGEVERRHKKKRRKKTHEPSPPLHHLPCESSSTSFSSLPTEIVVNCFTRISKAHHPSLSLVSKTFRSLLSSLELYKGHCFYVCLLLPNHPSPRWFSQWDLNITDHGMSEKKPAPRRSLLVPISSCSDSLPTSNSTVSVGSEIYAIGGSIVPSSSVRIFDCRSHTWRDAPNMKVARRDATACVMDDKIYVIGGCSVDDESTTTNWLEMFDTKTQTWRLITNPEEKDFAYQLKDGTRRIDLWCKWLCVVENVLYCFSDESGDFMWYDSVGKKWTSDISLGDLFRYWSSDETLRIRLIEIVNYGGKIAVILEKVVLSGRRSPYKLIPCKVFSMERLHGVCILRWFEMFDTKTQTWRLIANPDEEKEDFAYQLKEGTRRRIDLWCQRLCVVDNVLYSCSNSRGLMWYDSVGEKWANVKALDEVLNNRLHRLVEFVNYGGKMALMWERRAMSGRKKEIWWSLVSMERSHGGEIWGKVECCDFLLTVPDSSYCLRCLPILV